MRNSNFLVPPPLGVGVFGKLLAARKRKDRQRNRLGRSPHAPACPRNRKPAGDLARQIEPLPSRSGRHLDYESSGSPSPSRSYRRPETESLPVTEVTGSNLSHARPGAGRALVGNGETGRVQSQWNQPVTGIAYRQEDRRVRLQNRVVSTTARRALHTLSRNEKSNFFGAPSPGGRSVREITSREETERLPEESTRQIPARSRLSQEPKARWRSGRQIEPLPSRSRRLLDYESSGSPSPSRSYR